MFNRGVMKLFPFDKVREGQRELIKDVELCLRESRNLIANAPSGVGKTAATLAPALEYALDHDKVVFFLTPRHSQHRIAIETLRKIREKYDLKFSVVDIIGKKWLCPVPGIELLSTSDFNDYCATVKKEERCVFYNNTKRVGNLTTKAQEAFEKILNSGPLHAEELKTMCKRLCPYEIALEVAKRSRVIICDYYHIFSPVRNVVLSRINRELEDLILIIDEAHNLPERIRKVLSGKITTHSLNMAKKEAKVFGFIELSEKVEKMEKVIKDLAKGMKTEEEKYIEKEEFVKRVEEIEEYDSFIEELEVAAIEVRESRKKSYLGSLARFLDLWIGEDVGYARILRKEKKNDKTKIILRYVCLDSMIISKEIFDNAHSAILMSGTLSPMSMYKNVLGLDDRTICNKYKSCFPNENKLNLIIPDVTTQYTRRTEENYKQIADYIIKISSALNGNLAVFFPSYEVRDDILRMIRDQINKEIFVEKQDMTKEEKTKFFEEFMRRKNAILLGTQSGSFAEGVDFFGGVLKCVIVVGLALSKPDLETKALIDYYDYKFGKGWKYGYIYPAVNRALQSAGRCIRSERDRAVVIFMDKRFLWKNYRVAFPVDFEFKVTKKPEKLVKIFFNDFKIRFK